jgi:hypothetical protein
LGLVFDIIGAWFVAWEVVRQFHGKKHEPVCIITCSDMSAGPPPVETEDFKKWEKQKYFRMKLGLAALTIGFILQILSNFI